MKLLFTTFLPALILFFIGVAAAEVRIDEVLPEDRTVLADEDNDHRGWVELHNPSSTNATLTGYGLSDDPANPFRWTFPAVDLAPGGRLIVFIDGKDRRVPPDGTPPPPGFSPTNLLGLNWWIDASETSTLRLTNGRLSEWKDKTPRETINVNITVLDPKNVSGKILWLDAADLARFTLVQSAVSVWKDKSGLGNDASQSTNDNRPLRLAATTGTGGLVRFDGRNDYLVFKQRMETIRTMFFVGREAAQRDGVLRPFLGDSEFYDFARGKLGELIGNYRGSSPGGTNGAWRLNGARVPPLTTPFPAGADSGLNLVSLVAPANMRANNLSSERFIVKGGNINQVWNGDMAEILCFDRELADSEVAGIEKYLQQKWGTPNSLPAAAANPYQSIAEFQPVPVMDPLTGQTGILFDGINDAMGMELSHLRTIFWVGREAETASDNYRPILGGSVGGDFVRGPNHYIFYDARHSVWVNGQSVVPYNTPFPPGRVLLSVKTTRDTSADNLAADRPGLLLGRFWDGEINEILAFNRQLTDVERVQMETYLSRKWHLPSQNLHTNFKLKGNGDILQLTRPNGSIADSTPPIETRSDVSFGRALGSPSWQWYTTPSPNGANSGGVTTGVLPKPIFTPAPGMYAGQVKVGFITTNLPPGSTIEYTTDGSLPGPGNSSTRTLSQALTFVNSTVVRARAVFPNRVASRAATATYLLNTPPGLPVVSLATTSSNLFDPTWGMYVAGPSPSPAQPGFGSENWNQDWERPVHVEFFETNGVAGFDFECGLRIHGGYTRYLPQKSLRLHLRDRYGSQSLKYPLFPGSSVDQFDALILRNSGNDWPEAMLRDGLAQSLGAEVGLETQGYRPAHVYINGQYWGIHEIRERDDVSHIARHSGVPASDISLLKDEVEVIGGGRGDYNTLVDQVDAMFDTLGGSPQNESLYAAASSHMDIENYNNWLCTELFADNGDWPGHNVLSWRDNRPGGKWRWAMIDLDAGFTPAELYNPGQQDRFLFVFGDAPVAGQSSRSVAFPRGLVKNDTWRTLFVNRLADLLNTTFAPEHTLPRLEEFWARLAPGMPAHIQRWAGPFIGYDTIGSFNNWTTNVNIVRSFLNNRPAVLRSLISARLPIDGSVRVTLGATPGAGLSSLHFSTLHFQPTNLPWSGLYFLRSPVKARATPAAGYRFAGWQGRNETNNPLVFAMDRDTFITPLFTVDPGFDFNSVVPHPHTLATGPYSLTAWAPDSPAGSYPAAMRFLQTSVKDPDIAASMETFWTNRYDLTNRSRILGLGTDGFAFLNTSDLQSRDEGYAGSALLALRTDQATNIQVSWIGGTAVTNSRPYAIRLQWRIGTNTPFNSVLGQNGLPVEYIASSTPGHSQPFGPIPLPAAAENQPVIQLRWKYYALPNSASGGRPELRVDNILVTAGSTFVPTKTSFGHFNLAAGTVTIRFDGPSNRAVGLFASTDLRQWLQVKSGVSDASGAAELKHNSVGAPAQFYQMRLLP
ncbi:MAG: hypothetical protein EXS36_00330 [Pedosphaera sp.]|nr:hypothetical protein [Pedosphaera sp.]